ncbi:MAG: ribosome assembly RNA-binding protein YhbY [Gammaproteobacteria bacterium]|nr:ribosome assembly RNA-binding protein YhbY [Gammaproteobacteria bacterium]
MTDSLPQNSGTGLDAKTKRRMRQIAHHLDPVVSIGDQGMREGLIRETERALTDHELIKVRINTPAREDRHALGTELAVACEAAVVQRIGKVIVLFRANPEADPKLSNLARFGQP